MEESKLPARLPALSSHDPIILEVMRLIYRPATASRLLTVGETLPCSILWIVFWSMPEALASFSCESNTVSRNSQSMFEERFSWALSAICRVCRATQGMCALTVEAKMPRVSTWTFKPTS